MAMARALMIGLMVLGLAAGPGRAQDATAIEGVIARQMEAFKADDVAAAFEFASPTIRRLFGTPERFGEMVRGGYPMVWRPADVRFSGLETRGGRTVQSVVVTDGRGVAHMLDYEMIEQDGAWKINGVMLRRPGDAGA